MRMRPAVTLAESTPSFAAASSPGVGKGKLRDKQRHRKADARDYTSTIATQAKSTRQAVKPSLMLSRLWRTRRWLAEQEPHRASEKDIEG